jgi:hypothetical protein
VQGIMNQYRRVREHPIPIDHQVWMQNVCDNVKVRMGITPESPLDVSERPESYLCFLHEILMEIEIDDDSRSFSLLPQSKMGAINITINNTILKELDKFLNPPDNANYVNIDALEISLWDYYFNLKKVVKGNKEFEELLVTDCMSASITVSRLKVVVAEATPAQKTQVARNSFQEAQRVVAVDPGRNPIIAGVVYSHEAMSSIQHIENTHHATLKWGRRQHAQETGNTRRLRWTKRLSVRNADVTAFNNGVPTTKTSSLALYKNHARHVLEFMQPVMEFYHTKCFKRLKWKSYIETQKAYEKVVKILQGGVRNTLVVWGNAKFAPSGRGSPPVPTTKMRQKVGARIRCLDQDEYCTSKLCCGCHHNLHPFRIRNRRSYHLRVCNNVNCSRRVFDRNVSAAINIMYLFYNKNVLGQPTPVRFRRGAVLQAPAAPAPAPVAAGGGGGGGAAGGGAVAAVVPPPPGALDMDSDTSDDEYV